MIRCEIKKSENQGKKNITLGIDGTVKDITDEIATVIMHLVVDLPKFDQEQVIYLIQLKARCLLENKNQVTNGVKVSMEDLSQFLEGDKDV